MAKNKLTPQQDVITRQFFMLVAQSADHDQHELLKAQKICLNLLNYECTADGRFIEKDSTVTYSYGTHPHEGKECEWLDDYKEAIKQGGKDAQRNNQDTFKANRSEPSTYSKIRKALFPEDV